MEVSSAPQRNPRRQRVSVTPKSIPKRRNQAHCFVELSHAAARDCAAQWPTPQRMHSLSPFCTGATHATDRLGRDENCEASWSRGVAGMQTHVHGDARRLDSWQHDHHYSIPWRL